MQARAEAAAASLRVGRLRQGLTRRTRVLRATDLPSEPAYDEETRPVRPKGLSVWLHACVALGKATGSLCACQARASSLMLAWPSHGHGAAEEQTRCVVSEAHVPRVAGNRRRLEALRRQPPLTPLGARFHAPGEERQ